VGAGGAIAESGAAGVYGFAEAGVDEKLDGVAKGVEGSIVLTPPPPPEADGGAIASSESILLEMF